jgi:uncharacterized protein YciI
MFVVILTYKKSLEEVNQYLDDHKTFLDQGYANNFFVVSGPKSSENGLKTGGIIISQLKNRAKLEAILKEDPFYVFEVANYEIIEFNPTKYHSFFAPLIP